MLPDYVVVEGGIPTSAIIPIHTCEGGADITERGMFDAELVTTTPMYNFKLTL